MFSLIYVGDILGYVLTCNFVGIDVGPTPLTGHVAPLVFEQQVQMPLTQATREKAAAAASEWLAKIAREMGPTQVPSGVVELE